MPILISQQSQSKSTIFQSLMISLHSVLTLVLCWGTLVMAGCCLRYRLLVLGVPVLAPLAHNNDWDSRERREGGGLTSLAHTESRETQPDHTARHGRCQHSTNKNIDVKFSLFRSWLSFLGRMLCARLAKCGRYHRVCENNQMSKSLFWLRPALDLDKTLHCSTLATSLCSSEPGPGPA